MWFLRPEIVGTVLVSISLPSLHSLANTQQTTYQDEDGEATKESLHAFLRSWYSYLPGISSVAGLLCSLLSDVPPWFDISIWVSVTVEEIYVFFQGYYYESDIISDRLSCCSRLPLFR
jgi:hypothetical protein